MAWMNVCKKDMLDNGELFEYDYNDKKILVTKIQNNIYTTDRICTHEYADLSTGFLNEEEKTITCPLHFSIFNLENGKPQNPPAVLPLKVYENKIEGDSIYVKFDN